MPIPVTCPECDAPYRVPDEMAGKAIKCKKCGGRVPVPAEGEGAAASGADDAGEAAAPKKKSNTGKILAIVGGILALGCCVCGGGGAFGIWWFVGKATTAVGDFKKELEAIAKKEGIVIKGDGGEKKAGGGGTVIFEKKETLTVKDPVGSKGKPAKSYKVKLEQGKNYVIDMKAEKKGLGQDPYLVLLDPQGKEVAHDDDSGGGLDAQIRYAPTMNGEFTIQATCFAGVLQEGLPYVLTVKQQ
jgi:predicted Zn finger-like uncharacterized protein